MTHHQTLNVLPVSSGQDIRKPRSELEHQSSSHKAEKNIHFRSGSSSTAETLIIPSFAKLGRELKIRFEATDQPESREKEEISEDQKTAYHEGISWKRRQRNQEQIDSTTKNSLISNRVDSEPRIRIKMSLVQAESPVVSDLKEAQDAIKKLNDSLRNEKKLSAARETTIENLRHEINLLDEELVDKRKENDKYNEEMRKLRSKTTSLETENKILERQVKMMSESNKRLHNELHELRNKLRIQETKVGELRVQRSEAVRKHAHLLQTSVDKSTRLRYFLQQLQNEILAHSVTTKKFQIQKEALENLMQEDSVEDLQFKKYGLISPRKIRKSSYALTEEEKESLRRDVESALVGRHNKVPEKSVPVEKLTTAAERIVTEGLKNRLGRENEESSHMLKLIQEAKHQVKSLDRIESSHVETSKRLQDKVGSQLEALEVELKDLSDELRLAQISKREDEEKLRSITKFSQADAKVESVNVARRASQVEKLDLESVIHSIERKSEDSTCPMSPRDLEILSMKRKMADMLEEKLMLSDELIESRTSLSNLGSLLESRSLEKQKMEKELEEKEKKISATEESLIEAQKETLNLKEALENAMTEVGREREEVSHIDDKDKGRTRAHRVELNFKPNVQPALENKVETLKEELSAVRRNSITQLNKVIPAHDAVDKGVQVGDEAYKVDKARWESPRALRRRHSMDAPMTGFFKGERKVSRAELTLVKRADKGIQVEFFNDVDIDKSTDSFKREAFTEKLSQENQELKATLEHQEQDMQKLKEEVSKLRENKSENDSNGEQYPPFNYPKRVSGIWTALEDALKEKEQSEKRNKELKKELEKQEKEIQILLKSFKQLQEQEISSLSGYTGDNATRRRSQNCDKILKQKENMGVEKSRSLEEVMSVNDENLTNHAFVFDSEDGRRVPDELHFEANSKGERNIEMLESVIDSVRKDLANSEEQSKELETELYRKDEDLRKAQEEIELHKTKLSQMKNFLDGTSRDKENIEKDAEVYKNQVLELNAVLEETRKGKVNAQEELHPYKSRSTALEESLDLTRTVNNNAEKSIAEDSLLIPEPKSSLDENHNTVQEIEKRDLQIEGLKTAVEDMTKEYLKAEEEIERYRSEISELKVLLDEMFTEKHKTKEVSERLKSQISDLETALNRSQNELDETTTEIRLCKFEISQLKSQLDETRRAHQEAMNETERCKSQISILEASLAKTKREKTSTEEEITKNKNEISDLKALLEERSKENEVTKEEVQRYKYQMEDLKTSLADAKRENSWNVRDVNRYKSEISDLQASLDRSKKENANKTKEFELYKFEISDLQESLEEERRENRAANEKNEKHESEMSDLRSSLKTAQEESQIARDEIQRYKSQIEKERSDNSNAEKKIDEYESVISDLKNSVRKAQEESDDAIHDITERCKTRIADLEDLLHKERQKKQGSVKKIEHYETEISDLRRSLDEKQYEKQHAVDDIEAFKARISDLEASLEETKKENYTHEIQNSELKREVGKLEEKVERFKIKEAEIKLENRRFQTNNSELKITVDNLKNQLMGADKKVKDLNIQAEEDKRTISQFMKEQLGTERLQEQIKALETKVSLRDKNLEQKVEDKIERDEHIEQIAQEKEKLQKMIQDLLSAKQDDVGYNTADGETIVKIEAQSVCASPCEVFSHENLEDLHKGLEEFKKQSATLQVELKEIQREKADLQDTVQQLRNVKISQENELELLRKQIQEVESGVQDTERTLEKNAEVMAEKEKELRELVNEKVMKTSQFESLEASLSNALQDRDSTLAGK